MIDLASVQTNIVVFQLADGAADAAQVVAQARARGVLVNPLAARTVRALTHLDVTREQCLHAADVLVACVGTPDG